MISERLIDVNEDMVGQNIYVTGQFRSFNRHEEKKNRLVLSGKLAPYIHSRLKRSGCSLPHRQSRLKTHKKIYRCMTARKGEYSWQIKCLKTTRCRSWGRLYRISGSATKCTERDFIWSTWQTTVSAIIWIHTIDDFGTIDRCQ